MVAFDKSRIERAIEKAGEAAGIKDFSFIDEVIKVVIATLKSKLSLDEQKVLEVEEIQDIVENTLMELGFFDVAKKYVIYREYRNHQRKIHKEQSQELLEENKLEITKSNGKKEVFQMEKIRDTYKRVSY